jgi:hypothetical protein
VIKTKFEDAKGGNQKSYTKEGQAIKWRKNGSDSKQYGEKYSQYG